MPESTHERSGDPHHRWARVLTVASSLVGRGASLRRLDESGVIDRLTQLRFLCDLKEDDHDACEHAALLQFEAEVYGTA